MLTKGGENLKSVPKVISINDLSGYGRCSLTIAMPILSVLGVQCCPVPTAILSCHTGFDDFYFKDLTEIIPKYLSNWKSNAFEFDAVYSGFLGSYEQIRIAQELISSFRNKPLCIIDTVMGDNGKIYSTYTEKMCNGMKELISYADVITPNVTEACYLSDISYTGEDISFEKAQLISRKLCEKGAKSVVITGIVHDNMLSNFVFENGEGKVISSPQSIKTFAGTGDIFSSVVTGMLVSGHSLEQSVTEASQFIYKALEYTISLGSEVSEGVVFEPLLYTLGGKHNG